MSSYEERQIELEAEYIALMTPEKEYLTSRLKELQEKIDASKARINGYRAIIQRKLNDV